MNVAAWRKRNSLHRIRAAATTPGSVAKKMQVFDETGASLGYVAIYDAIT